MCSSDLTAVAVDGSGNVYTAYKYRQYSGCNTYYPVNLIKRDSSGTYQWSKNTQTLQADAGRPTVVADPDGAISAIYKNIARQVAIRVANLAKDMSSKFPNIVVQNT